MSRSARSIQSAEMVALRKGLERIAEEEDVICDFDGFFLRDIAQEELKKHRERLAMAHIDRVFGSRWYAPKWLPDWAFNLLCGYHRQ